MVEYRLVFRAANLLHDSYLKVKAKEPTAATSMDLLVEVLNAHAEQIASAARGRDALSFSNQLSWRASTVAAAFERTVDAIVETVKRPYQVPPVSELVEEIRWLEREFGELRIDRGYLQVTAGPITLEGIELGRFSIRLPYKAMKYNDEPFMVVALEPNASCVDSAVTHPHVKHNDLCAGEGRTALVDALKSGRIAGAFMIVRSVLENYTEGSAYVELHNWYEDKEVEEDGYLCSYCGDDVPEDEMISCGECSEPLCGDCEKQCCSCNRRYGCPGCMTECFDCHGYTCSRCTVIIPTGFRTRQYCGNCAAKCTDCDKTYKNDELDEGYCLDCRGRCTDCEELLPNEELDEEFCSECRTRCTDCNELYSNKDLEAGFCADCAPAHKKETANVD